MRDQVAQDVGPLGRHAGAFRPPEARVAQHQGEERAEHVAADGGVGPVEGGGARRAGSSRRCGASPRARRAAPPAWPRPWRPAPDCGRRLCGATPSRARRNLTSLTRSSIASGRWRPASTVSNGPGTPSTVSGTSMAPRRRPRQGPSGARRSGRPKAGAGLRRRWRRACKAPRETLPSPCICA